jgi:predicted CXXCH cytochrome family protein
MRRHLRSFGLALAAVVIVLIVPQRGGALNPVHECASCHDLHGGFPMPMLAGASVEETCLSCHAVAINTTQPVAVHEQDSWANYAHYRVTCLDCHNPHSDRANWLGPHATDGEPPVPADWQPSTAYAVDDIVRPTDFSSRQFRNTTAGTSGGSEPDWNASIDGTTNDGTAVWTAGYLWVPGMNVKLIGWRAPSGTTSDMWGSLPAGAAVVWSYTYDPNIVAQPPANVPCTERRPKQNDITPLENECYTNEWRRVVFEQRGSDDNPPYTRHTFAEDDEDGNNIRDGICEACHTLNSGIGHHYNDQTADGHHDGQTCSQSSCHRHDIGFIK